jgi:hypothetical protein
MLLKPELTPGATPRAKEIGLWVDPALAKEIGPPMLEKEIGLSMLAMEIGPWADPVFAKAMKQNSLWTVPFLAREKLDISMWARIPVILASLMTLWEKERALQPVQMQRYNRKGQRCFLVQRHLGQRKVWFTKM